MITWNQTPIFIRLTQGLSYLIKLISFTYWLLGTCPIQLDDIGMGHTWQLLQLCDECFLLILCLYQFDCHILATPWCFTDNSKCTTSNNLRNRLYSWYKLNKTSYQAFVFWNIKYQSWLFTVKNWQIFVTKNIHLS